jgi:hypothetical protein
MKKVSISRLGRANRTTKELGILSSGGADVIADNAFKSTWRVNDAEYDYICENATDEEMDDLALIGMNKVSDAKRALRVMEKHLKDYYDNQEKHT